MTTLPKHVGRLLDDLGRADVAGDLAEELRAGTRSWLWAVWQIIAAIVSGVSTVLHQNVYLAFRAIATAWITFQILNGQLPFSAHPEVRVWIHASAAWPFVIMAQYFAAGRVVSLLHRQHRAAMVVAATLFFMSLNTLEYALRGYFMFRMNGSIDTLHLLLGLMLWLVLPAMVIAGGLLHVERSERIARID